MVAEPPEARRGDRQRLLEDEVGKLVVEARRVGANLDEVIAAIRAGWKDMRGEKVIIETQGLTKKFWRHEAVHALNLAVPEGATCALVGANGAGKTTLLRMLVNLLKPDSGSAQVLGVDSRRLAPAEFCRIGYVAESQEFAGPAQRCAVLRLPACAVSQLGYAVRARITRELSNCRQRGHYANCPVACA